MIFIGLVQLLPVALFATALADGLQPGHRDDIDEYMNRIFGGNQAPRPRLPYLTLVEPSLESGGRTPICGGALTAPTKVVTAAYCVTDALGVLIPATVTLGLFDRANTTENSRQVRNVTVEQIELSCNGLYAVLTLSPGVPLSNRIQTIPYAPTGAIFSGTQGVASGWGITAANDTSFEQFARFIPGRIITNTVCAQSFLGLESYHICLNGRNGGGTCFGDTGGVLTGTSNSVTVLLGVALPRPRPLCGVNLPSVFVRVEENISCSVRDL